MGQIALASLALGVGTALIGFGLMYLLDKFDKPEKHVRYKDEDIVFTGIYADMYYSLMSHLEREKEKQE